VKTDTKVTDDGAIDDVATEDDTTEEGAAEAGTDGGDTLPGEKSGGLGGKLPQSLMTVAIALVVAATAVAGWYGVRWISAANDDSLAYSKTREEVNRVALAAVVTMNQLDYRKIDDGLKDWEAATTGTLHDEIAKNRASIRDSIVARQSVSTATPLSSAVREMDERAGKASVMVAIKMSVDVTETLSAPPAEVPGITCKQVEGQKYRCQGVKYQRLEASLQRTDAGWKLDKLAQVPYVQGQ
jgi:Mce-associated membrane protein